MHQKSLWPNKNKNHSGTIFFIVYIGSSMNPTLRESELMEIVPYDNRPLRVGDVVLFLLSTDDQFVVHRIIRISPAGISTRGDNNTKEDAFLLQPSDIKGQAVAVWRGQKRREIAGGLQGQWISYWLHWRRIPSNALFHLLHPLYSALSRYGLIAKWLPASFQVKVVVFQTQGQDRYRLLFRKHIIGRYDDQKRQWKIQRPFRLLVDERILPRQQNAE